MIFVLVMVVWCVVFARYALSNERKRIGANPNGVAADERVRPASREGRLSTPIVTNEQSLWTAWDQHQLDRLLDQSSP
jgi:hypothetical protein